VTRDGYTYTVERWRPEQVEAFIRGPDVELLAISPADVCPWCGGAGSTWPDEDERPTECSLCYGTGWLFEPCPCWCEEEDET
jgi:hypothetical protein